ncbi:MAG: hypothetical protein ACRDTE_09235 [Pseudonocardiaceae bacterium]
MAGRCEAGPCLPGANSGWFLLLLAAVWAVVLVLGVMLVIVRRRERRAPARPRRVAEHARSAVTVAEIGRRLDRERQLARRAQRRVVRVVPRQAMPTAPEPDTAPLGPVGDEDE